MENLNLNLFLCIVAPMVLMLFVFKKEARLVVGFLVMGLFICVFAGEINSLLFQTSGLDTYTFTTNITPITEEILKAIPVVFFALIFKPNSRLLLECSVSLGIGFSILENVNILISSNADISFMLALSRGLGVGMVHALTGLIVGYTLGVIIAKRKLILPGTVSILSVAIIYHSIYNVIVQSPYSMLGILLPSVTFIIGYTIYQLINNKKLEK